MLVPSNDDIVTDDAAGEIDTKREQLRQNDVTQL